MLCSFLLGVHNVCIMTWLLLVPVVNEMPKMRTRREVGVLYWGLLVFDPTDRKRVYEFFSIRVGIYFVLCANFRHRRKIANNYLYSNLPFPMIHEMETKDVEYQ